MPVLFGLAPLCHTLCCTRLPPWRTASVQCGACLRAGFCFAYYKHKSDGQACIDDCDGMEFGSRRRPLKLEWAKVRAIWPSGAMKLSQC